MYNGKILLSGRVPQIVTKQVNNYVVVFFCRMGTWIIFARLLQKIPCNAQWLWRHRCLLFGMTWCIYDHPNLSSLTEWAIHSGVLGEFCRTKALVVRWILFVGILIGLAFMFCAVLIPLDMGNLCMLNSITCLWVTVYPWHGNRDT